MEAGCGSTSSTLSTSAPTASSSRTAITPTGTQIAVPLKSGTHRLSKPVFVSIFIYLTNYEKLNVLIKKLGEIGVCIQNFKGIGSVRGNINLTLRY